MIRQVSIRWIFLVGLVVAPSQGFSQEAPAVRRLALLIGVQRYPALAENEQLEGCANDVELMRRVLVERLQFPEASIDVLLNEQATAAGIRRALAALAEKASQTDLPTEVVLHFSGHGSQIADQPADDPDADESDGLDETLVPFDATRQGGQADIRDDELYRFAGTLTARGNIRLWCVLDCCHSGSGLRGVTRVRQLHRDVPVGRLQAVPAPAVRQKQLPPGVVVLSACRAHEVEPEYQENERHYGLLTRFLAQAVFEEPDVSSLTYRELTERIVRGYHRSSSVFQAPVPQLEADANTLMARVAHRSSSASAAHTVQAKRLEGTSRQVTMSIGALHGVTRGSLYELLEDRTGTSPPRQNATPELPARWLRVDEVSADSSIATVVRRAGDELIPDQLPERFQTGIALERVREPGSNRLRVRIEDVLSPGRGLGSQSAVPDAIRKALTRPGNSGRVDWLEWTIDSEPCDVVIRFAGSHAAMFPATGLPWVPGQVGDSGAPLRGGWGPVNLDRRDADQQLWEILRRVTRARNVLRVAAEPGPLTAETPRIKVELLGIELDANQRITRSWPWKSEVDAEGRERMTVRNGTPYTVRVTNLEVAGQGKPVYVTVLNVTADMGIDVLFPYQLGGDMAAEQRLAPGESKMSGPWRSGSLDGTTRPGPRTIVAIATLASANESYLLAQQDLPVTRSAGLSPLDMIFEEQAFFRTRAGFSRVRKTPAADSSWTSVRLSWDLVP